jgi:thiol-disulfide isomerase/thioredoxin
MKPLFAAVLAAALVASTSAQDAKQDPKKIAKPAPQQKERPPVTLKVGDKAPELKATKWLQGDAVTSFEKDKVYVVEFWATWCGPCIVMMPHLSDLQTEYKSKGVTFIGYAAEDDRGSNEKTITEFVKKRGPNLKYTFAYAADRETNKAWMGAAGQTGIPCCFVVAKDGTLAYIGHPMYLDVVLPKVAAGTWKNDEDTAAVEKVKKDVAEMGAALRGEPEAGLKAVAAFDAKYPPLVHIPYHLTGRISLMLRAQKYDEAKKYAESVLARAAKQHDPTAMQAVAAVFRGPLAKDNKDLVLVSVNAAEAVLKLAGDKDARALIGAADANFTAGNKEKAKEYATKAVAAAENDTPAIKKFIGDQAKKYLDEKKD